MKPKIVSLGTCYVDINVDGFPFSDEGIPSERELIGGQYDLVAGGSAVNALKTVGKLGVLQPVFVGAVGDDGMADILTDSLESAGVEHHLQRKSGFQTNISFNMTNASGGHIMLAVGTANASLDGSVREMLERALEGAAYLYLGGVFKLQGLKNDLIDIIRKAKQSGVKVVIDHGRVPANVSGEDRRFLQAVVMACDIYLPSKDELLCVWEVGDVAQALNSISRQTLGLLVVVKDGPRAVVFQNGLERGAMQPELIEKVQNMTGAGDTFNGSFLSGLERGDSIEKSIAFACHEAASKVKGEEV